MFVVVTALVGALAATPASPEQVRKHVDSILADGSYQTKLPLPGDGSDAKVPPPVAKKQEFKPSKRRERRSREYEVGGFGHFAQLLMYILMIAGIVALVFWAVSELSGYWKDKPDDDAEGLAGGDDDAVVTRPLGDADALAQQGKFGEAIHVLLLRTLLELSARGDKPLPDSLTSREILRRVDVPDDARNALSGLITAVEVSHFGEAVPGEPEYHACLQRFQQFASAYTRGRR